MERENKVVLTKEQKEMFVKAKTGQLPGNYVCIGTPDNPIMFIKIKKEGTRWRIMNK